MKETNALPIADASWTRGRTSQLISVVVPCYNEAAVLRETHRHLILVLEQLAEFRFEIIYVDDGSRDGTLEILREQQAVAAAAATSGNNGSGGGNRGCVVRVVSMSRNFGHQAAISAGLAHGTGQAVVVIDADLQDPPEVIREMIALWREGYHVVYGVRTDRAGETRFKRWSARVFYRLHNRLSETKLPLDAGDFRLLDRRVVDVLLEMPERDRFLRGMVSWIGFKQVAVMFARAPRHAGTTKYPPFKMLHLAVDGVISFSLTPLRLALWLGFASLGVALAGIIYAIVVRLYTDDWVRGWASIFTAVLFLGGVQLITLGIVGEYLGRIYAEVKRRPLYIVQERLGFGAQQPPGQPSEPDDKTMHPAHDELTRSAS